MRTPWLSRSLLSVVLVGVVALAIVALHSERASVAEASCVPGRTSQSVTIHDGWARSPGQTVYGVESEEIEEYDPYVVNATNKLSTAWVMLTTVNHDKWAQIGWIKIKRSGYSMQRWIVVQTSDDGGATNHTYFFSPKQVGNFTDYRAEYEPGVPRFRLYADDEWYISTNVDVFAPNEAQIYGEINDPASQMPGGYGNGQVNDQAHEWMYTSRWKNSFQWLAFNGTGWITPNWEAYFGQAVYNYWDIDIWDKACQN